MYDDNIELGPIAGPSRSSERVEIGPQEHARGHFYSQNYIRDHARVRFGDVYNYRNSESSERNVLDWLTSLNPSESHSQACQKYQEGTLEWFFADSRFEEWRWARKSHSVYFMVSRHHRCWQDCLSRADSKPYSSRKGVHRLSCRGLLSLPGAKDTNSREHTRFHSCSTMPARRGWFRYTSLHPSCS